MCVCDFHAWFLFCGVCTSRWESVLVPTARLRGFSHLAPPFSSAKRSSFPRAPPRRATHMLAQPLARSACWSSLHPLTEVRKGKANLTVGRQKPRLRGSRHTNPRYPTRPKDIHLENLEREKANPIKKRACTHKSRFKCLSPTYMSENCTDAHYFVA